MNTCIFIYIRYVCNLTVLLSTLLCLTTFQGFFFGGESTDPAPSHLRPAISSTHSPHRKPCWAVSPAQSCLGFTPTPCPRALSGCLYRPQTVLPPRVQPPPDAQAPVTINTLPAGAFPPPTPACFLCPRRERGCLPSLTGPQLFRLQP